jgi:tRNA-splicing ligase RtcB
MSHKYRVEKVSDNHYILPAIKEMKCRVDAFLSPELYEQTDEALWQQAVDSASYDGAIGMYLMPDTHLGYGIPVGGVLVTENSTLPTLQ